MFEAVYDFEEQIILSQVIYLEIVTFLLQNCFLFGILLDGSF